MAHTTTDYIYVVMRIFKFQILQTSRWIWSRLGNTVRGVLYKNKGIFMNNHQNMDHENEYIQPQNEKYSK